MSETANQIEQIEVTIEEVKEQIALKDTLERLTNNPDFKRIILEGYFEKEAQRLVMLRADFNFREPQDQGDLLKAIDAIGQLRMYLGTLKQFGISAEGALASHEEARDELLSEDE